MTIKHGCSVLVGLFLLCAPLALLAQTTSNCDEPMMMASSAVLTSSAACEPVSQPGSINSISVSPSISHDGHYTVSWSAASGMVTSGFDTWGYELHEFNSGVLTQTLLISPTATTYAVSGQSNGSYQYQVRGCNLQGGEPYCGPHSSISNTVVVDTGVMPPSSILAPTAINSDGAYTISWGSSSTSAVTYELEERFKPYGSPVVHSWTQIYAGTALSKSVSGRTDGEWEYQVRACNSASCSAYLTANAVTVWHPIPTAPSEVTAPVETSQSTYLVSWTASTSSYADSYQISNRHESGTWSVWANASGTSTNVTVDQSGNWTHRVVACNTLPDGSKKCSDTPRVSNSVHAQLPAPWAQTGGNVADDFGGALSGLSHDPEVGAVQGEPGVSGGAATYQIPIAVPPGRSSMTPSVALNYSSRSGNGIAGVGWSLSATSSIHRCSATPAQDGYRLAATLSVSDKLCLDGQRLMLVSGTYGQSGAVYRTEQDSFAQVVQLGAINSSSSFTVHYANNTRGYFGTTTDSRQVPSGSSIIASWAIAVEQDASGNTIEYRYSTPVVGEHLLHEILYTGYNATPGTRKVSFFYEARPDASRSWRGGGLSQNTRRLKSIETSVSGSPVREYRLGYDLSLSTGRSLLTSVMECADNYCLPATEFFPHHAVMAWQPTDSSRSENRALTPSGDTAGLDRVKQQDLNGDGIPEAIYMHAQFDQNDQLTGFNVQIYYQDPSSGAYTLAYDGLHDATDIGNGIYHYDSGDLNGDGITDFFIVDGSGNVSLFQFDENLQPLPLISTNLTMPQSFVTSPAFVGTSLQLVDVNGDGHQDVVYADTDNVLYYFRHAGVASSTAEFTGPFALLTLDTYVNNNSTKRQQPSFMDVDGDGVLDIVLTWQNGRNSKVIDVAFGLVTSTGAYQIGAPLSASQLGLPSNNFYHEHAFADVNGDGLADFIRPVKVAGVLHWSVRENKGNRIFGAEGLLGTGIGIHEHISIDDGGYYYVRIQSLWGRGLRIADIDSDGAAELIVATGSSDDVCVDFIGAPTSSGSTEPYSLTVCNDAMHAEEAELTSHPGYKIDIDFGRYDIRRFNWDVIDIAQTSSGLGVSRIVSDVVNAPLLSFVDRYGNHTSGLDIRDVNNDGFSDFTYTVMRSYSQSAGSGQHIAVAGVHYSMATVVVNHTASSPAAYEGYYEQLNDATIGVNAGKLVDTNSDVVNGLGQTYQWRYSPLSRPHGNRAGGAFYSVPGFNLNDERYVTNDTYREHFYFTSSMYVVSDTLESNGVGGLNETEYNYREAVYNTTGRGFQGFRQIIVDDKARGSRAVSTFHQIFPYAGQLESLRTCLVSDGNLCTQPLTERTYAYDVKNTATAAVKWVYPSSQTERLFDLNSRTTELNEKVTTIAAADVDNFGNVNKVTVVTDNGFHAVETIIVSVFDTGYTSGSWWWPHKRSSQAKTTQTISRDTTVAASILSGTDAARTTTTTYSYNSDGITHRKPTQIITSASDTAKTHQVTHVFNDYGLLTSTTQVGSGSGSDLNRVTSFGYSADGYFVASVTNDKGHVSSRSTSTEHGQPISATDANGTTVTYTYDPFGRMTSQSVPGGAPIETGLISCAYSCDSPAATYYRFTQQEGSPLQKVFYDLLNRERMKAVTGFGGLTVYSRVDYNARGDKTFESVPSHSTNSTEGTTFISYDALGRVTRKETDRAEGGWLVTDYIYSGHTTHIEANDGITLFMSRTHGGDGKLIRTKDALNGYTRYAYDSAGNPITLQDANGSLIYAFYNGLGHKTEVRDPNMGTKLFSYNTFGELEFETDAKSVVTQTLYDGLGRVVTRKVAGTVQASYAYDSQTNGIGLLSSESAVGYQAVYSYDSYSRMVQKVTSVGGEDYTSRTEFDANYGRVKAVEHASGIKVAYEYDQYGNLLKVKNAGSGFIYQENLQADALQNITQSQMNHGTLYENRTYDQVSGQLKRVRATSAMGNELHDIDYTYASFGNLASQTVYSNNGASVSTESYNYDDLHRLTYSNLSSGPSISYSYDATGNLTQKSDYASSMSYGSAGKTNSGNAGPNAVLSATLVGGGTASFTYDNNGNLTSGAGKSITYNAMNKPTHITAGSTTVSFWYDANWQRYKKAIGSSKTLYYIDGSVEVEYTGGDIITRTYIDDIAIIKRTEHAGVAMASHEITYTLR
uniref:SpvB/TcaC N-terminal domain-containing protein n=1 Tax=Pseudidiomarina mangrovi TaxID=2487133 RepID=UPI000FCA820E